MIPAGRHGTGPMGKLQNKAHNFSSKLQQQAVLPALQEYISWRRALESSDAAPPPSFGPVSINLDLTSACNFACPHCVDSGIINTGEYLAADCVKRSIDTLCAAGLKSVIIIGGGEPALHRDFEELLRFIKSSDLQVGIVTNGTRLDRVAPAAAMLQDKDWLRLSIDAATQQTFEASHKPKIPVTLQEILSSACDIKRSNPALSLGYSFVIVWEGLQLNGKPLQQNVSEMADAVRLAAEHQFDYVSFKPCLIRLADSQKESLLPDTDKSNEERIRDNIRRNLDMARAASRGETDILESVNLTALINNEVVELKNQPQTCHMQYFRTVLAPSGIFHCPAFRGVDKARIGKSDDYDGSASFHETLRTVAGSIDAFNAHEECRDVGCFYHHANCRIEDFILSGRPVDELEAMENDNFFL